MDECKPLHYGPMYRETLLEAVRRQVESAESLQSFMLLHSLGRAVQVGSIKIRVESAYGFSA